jgi:integrase/recombinase XerD
MQELIEQFVKEKQYVKNVTPKTVRFYRQSLNALIRTIGSVAPSALNKALLNECIIKWRENGLSAISCNTYISGINAFLTWLHENGLTTDRLRMKELKTEKKVVQTFTDDHLKRMLNYRPKDFYGWRIYALSCLLIDTGLRIEEALTIEMPNLDLDNLLVAVCGKGQKQRIVPFSFECRKILWRYLKLRPKTERFLFCTKGGCRLSYYNALRDFHILCKKQGIIGVRCSFHTLRHTFAYRYAQSFARMTGSAENGILHLQKQLGHTSLTMTRRYVELQPEDLKEAHARTSILNRMR